MDIAKDILDRIGQPESELLEYKAVLPPAATVAQLIGAFANTKGGAIVLGVVDQGKGVLINGLSDEFRAVQITRKAIDLLSPTPAVKYDYVDHQGKRLFVIEVQKSATAVLLGGKSYVRDGYRTALTQAAPEKPSRTPASTSLSKRLFKTSRKSCTAARAKLLDHYESVLLILDDLGKLLYPKGSSVPTDNAEGKMLMRILFSSCADNFEIFMSDLLYEIYLAKPETLKSNAHSDRQGCSGLFRHAGVHQPVRQGEAEEASTRQRQGLHRGQQADQVAGRVRRTRARRRSRRSCRSGISTPIRTGSSTTVPGILSGRQPQRRIPDDPR